MQFSPIVKQFCVVKRNSVDKEFYDAFLEIQIWLNTRREESEVVAVDYPQKGDV